MKFERIRSGGQTGADQGGLKAAYALGVRIVGWCPKGRRSETGRIPDIFPLEETPSSDYVQRTDWNARDSDATVLFTWGSRLSRGSELTASCCRKHNKPCLHVDLKSLSDVDASNLVVEFARQFEVECKRPIKDLNIAGTRESKAPGIEAKVERVMVRVFTHDWPAADPRTPPESAS